MSYRVEFAREAAKQLDALPRRMRERIVLALHGLATDPRSTPNGKALQGGGYRLRVGDYRVLYDLLDDRLIVLVLRVAHRREAYRRQPRA